MSQHDFNVANQGFPAFRGDMNNALAALASNSSGATAPSTTYANQWWYDTSTDTLKIRSEANDAWISVAVLDQTNGRFVPVFTGPIEFADGSASLPSLTNTGDTNTGLFFPAADTVAVATGGSERLRVDASGNFYVGTTSQSGGSNITFSQPANADMKVAASASTGTRAAYQVFVNNTVTTVGTENSTGGSLASGTAAYSTVIANNGAYPISFATNNTERARIDASGNLLVGTTTDIGAKLVAKSSGSAGSLNSFIAINSSGTVLLQVRDDGLITTSTVGAGPYALTTASAANMVVTSGGEFRRSTSSLKYKTDVQNATNGLEKVLALRPVTYKGVNDGTTVFGGLIAEEVHDAGLTEFVQYADDGTPDALAYGQMVSLAFKAIQEQQAIIADLTARVAALEA